MTEFVANFPTTWDNDEFMDYPYRKFPCLVWKDNVCYLIASADVWNMNSLHSVYMCIHWPDLWIFRNETAPNHDDVNIDIGQCDQKLDQERRNTLDWESLLRILLGFMLNKHGAVDTIFLLCGDSLPEWDTCDDACGRAGGRREAEC